jgi:hypothetical protein
VKLSSTQKIAVIAVICKSLNTNVPFLLMTATKTAVIRRRHMEAVHFELIATFYDGMTGKYYINEDYRKQKACFPLYTRLKPRRHAVIDNINHLTGTTSI